MGIFYELLCVGQIRLKNHPLVLQKTQLGWIVAGGLYGMARSDQKILQCNFMCNKPILDFDLSKFWELEEVPSCKVLSSEQIACEEHFVKNTTRNSEGRYIVRLLFNGRRNEIGHSRNVALRRLHFLENRFHRQPELKSPYDEFLSEYEQLGHMSQLENDGTTPEGFYLPHHAVVKEDSLTTKIRVVFDGSAKSSTGVSLNDSSMVGPVIQDELFVHLTRFRSRKYALTADMEKCTGKCWYILKTRCIKKVLTEPSAMN